MSLKVESREFIISWNNRYIYDRIYRKKYNIKFNSKEHREISQIDIYLDLLEDYLFRKWGEDYQLKKELREDYKKTGEFLIPDEGRIDKEDEELLKKFKFGQDIQ